MTYCWHCQEHNNELFLIEYWVLYELVCEADKASSTLFQKRSSITCEVCAIDLNTLWWQQR